MGFRIFLQTRLHWRGTMENVPLPRPGRPVPTPRSKRLLALMLPLLAAASLTASCATAYGPGRVHPGDSEADVVRTMGAPTGRYTMPSGATRLEFARGPFGLDTYMVNLDSAGKVTGWDQVLTESHFAVIKQGMTRDELLQALGHPSDIRFVARPKPAAVWSYRYHTVPTFSCTWFQVSVGDDNQVLDTSYGIDPRCDPGDAARP